jgi:hypothetical protein
VARNQDDRIWGQGGYRATYPPLFFATMVHGSGAWSSSLAKLLDLAHTLDMDGFIRLLRALFVEAGLSGAYVFCKLREDDSGPRPRRASRRSDSDELLPLAYDDPLLATLTDPPNRWQRSVALQTLPERALPLDRAFRAGFWASEPFA